MNKEKALELQGLRAAHLDAVRALLLGTTAASEVVTTGTPAERYASIHDQLGGARFYRPSPDNDWEVTGTVRVAAGAEPMSWVGLRFLRFPGHTEGELPATIMAQWCHGQGDTAIADDTTDTFTVLAFGEVFASEYVTTTEIEVAAEHGDPLVPMKGSDPRPLDERLALLEQSLTTFLEAQSSPA